MQSVESLIQQLPLVFAAHVYPFAQALPDLAAQVRLMPKHACRVCRA